MSMMHARYSPMQEPSTQVPGGSTRLRKKIGVMMARDSLLGARYTHEVCYLHRKWWRDCWNSSVPETTVLPCLSTWAVRHDPEQRKGHYGALRRRVSLGAG